eukprot:895218-Pyramimonas_sp.AAC.1
MQRSYAVYNQHGVEPTLGKIAHDLVLRRPTQRTRDVVVKPLAHAFGVELVPACEAHDVLFVRWLRLRNPFLRKVRGVVGVVGVRRRVRAHFEV